MTDADWMGRALFAAERGRGTTAPNPLVGAVVVSAAGVVLGQGAHRRAGEPHAEPQALDAAGEAARGATLYCTLEPCCHTGRTGPCVERIAAAGIRRVVTATEDPNPQVSGGGHGWLRARGIEVVTGVRQDEARHQNAPFFTWMGQGRPWTILKTATTRDGLVGLAGHRTRLTGAIADRWMQRQRAWIDALMVGAETVIVDDPVLTPRGVHRERPLTRVVIDWRGRVPEDARLWSTLSVGPVIMVTSAAAVTAAPERVARLESAGVGIEVFESRRLETVWRKLGRLGVQSLLLEGGAALQQACLDQGLVDWLQWVVTPVADLGQDEAAGVPMAPGISDRLADSGRRRRLGADVLVEGTASGASWEGPCVHGID